MGHLKDSVKEIEVMLTKNSDKEFHRNRNKLKPIIDMVIQLGRLFHLGEVEMILNTIQMLENMQVVVWVTLKNVWIVELGVVKLISNVI